MIARLPFHSAAQLLGVSVSTPVSFWPRLAFSAGYGAALLAIAWTAWLRRVSVRGSRSTRFPPGAMTFCRTGWAGAVGSGRVTA